MRYFTSDHHHGHEPILSYCNRPFLDLKHQTHVLIDNINRVVTPKDHLYVLGDFSFYDKDTNHSIVKSINCPVTLIRGNHDHTGRIKNVPFAEVHDELDIQLGNRIVTLSHFPYWIKNPNAEHEVEGSGKQPDRYPERRPKDVGLWLLHGHTHDTGRIRREHRMLHVGVDAWSYAPISELDIIKMIEDK